MVFSLLIEEKEMAGEITSWISSGGGRDGWFVNSLLQRKGSVGQANQPRASVPCPQLYVRVGLCELRVSKELGDFFLQMYEA